MFQSIPASAAEQFGLWKTITFFIYENLLRKCFTLWYTV